MSRIRPEDLTCELQRRPRGLATDRPRFGWALGGGRRGSRQTAYRIRVGEDGAVWDSGKVASDRTQHIAYGGAALPPAEAVRWEVEVWDEADRPSVRAEPATIFTGLPPAAWRARWIARRFFAEGGREVPADSPYDNPWQARPADYLRREFTLDRPLRRALVHASALGCYQLRLNGAAVGDDVFAPGWTDYHIRVPYQVHDVTDLLRPGPNVLGAILGEGWYSGRIGSNAKRAGQHYGGRPALIAQLELHFEDGTRERIVSDGDWRTSLGPIFYSDFLVGERYDARAEMPEWDAPGFDDTGWQPVEAFDPVPMPLLEPERCPPVREIMEIPLRHAGTRPDGRLIYDSGQNLAGYVRLEVRGEPAPGAAFVLRHAERLEPDGGLHLANLRSAPATDVFIARGGRGETFKPHFTFHGFQYVELTLPEGITPEDVTLTAIALHNDLPVTGSFDCGNTMVRRLADNIEWSQRSNFLAVPTDCPQRDERLGWTADAQVFWRTAGFNMDVAAFTAKWMRDILDAQLPDGAFTDVAPSRPLNPWRHEAQPGAPGWGDAGVILPWQQYLRYGDRALMAACWPAMEAWMAHIATANPDRIRRNAVYNNYGDWLSVGPESDRALVATAYWVHVADLMARMAEVLGRDDAAAHYRREAGEIRTAFRTAFVEADGRLSGDTQTAYLLALDFHVLPPELHARAAEHLRRRIADADGHLQTGFLGVRHLCPVLADIGATEAAYRLLLNDGYPSWGFSIRHGATTIWERWDGWTPEAGFQSARMNSFNHYAYGAVGEWLYARVAGIDWDESAPGFRAIRFRPLFDRRIGWCRASYRAPTGTVESAWRIEGDHVDWTIRVPANCRGTVELPQPAAVVRLDGAELPADAGDDAGTRLAVGPGPAAFRIDLA